METSAKLVVADAAMAKPTAVVIPVVDMVMDDPKRHSLKTFNPAKLARRMLGLEEGVLVTLDDDFYGYVFQTRSGILYGDGDSTYGNGDGSNRIRFPWEESGHGHGNYKGGGIGDGGYGD